MPSIIELLQLSEEFLRKKNVKNPRLDSELLFSFVLNCKRLDLYLMYKREIKDPELSNLRNAIYRRGMREPLQYIIGNVDFFGLKLQVSNDVLIPRNETEELVDIIVKKFNKSQPKTILDLGTGSGAIALSLAKKFKDSQVLAVDISSSAISVAKKNAKINKLQNVKFLQSHWFDNVSGKFDIIISNPPYLSENEMESADIEVKDFEPKIALVSEKNGLQDIFEIISKAGNFLNDGGVLSLETGPSQHQEIRDFSSKYFKKFLSLQDMSKHDRFAFLWDKF